MHRFFAPLAVAALVATGCTTVSTLEPRLTAAGAAAEPLRESLFPSDQAVLGNEDIQRILAARVRLPERARLAVLRFGQRSERIWWSEEFARLDALLTTDVVGKLRASPRIADVSLMPAMLTPREMTVPLLREAAARLQADLLLVYRTSSHAYRRYRFFRPDRVRAYTTVEAILLDIRTGIVPFTSVGIENYLTERRPDELQTEEAAQRAEQEAVATALRQVAEDLVQFLGKAQ